MALALFCWGLSAQTASPVSAKGATTQDSSDTDTYVFALAALGDGGLAAGDRPFLSRLPALILEDLDVLPPRVEDAAYLRELAERRALAERFDLGGDLLAKMDGAAAARLGASLTGKNDGVATADAALDKAASALSPKESARLGSGGSEGAGGGTLAPEPEGLAPLSRSLIVKAWDGKGKLFDPGTDTALRAGRKQSIDLVVTGTARPVGSYVEVNLVGTDVGLGRTVFTWRGFASPDDPAPLARDFAKKLSAWLSSVPTGRLDVSVQPATARVLIDGKAFDSSDLVLFSPDYRGLSISAWAPGYLPENRSVLIIPGEERGLVLDLEPQSYGLAHVSIEPADASLFVAGEEVDPTRAISLEGMRDIASAKAKGFEPKLFALPASGSKQIGVSLHPLDAFGPGGRAEKAKDDFYVALGLVALGVPATSIAQGYQTLFTEANLRAGTGFLTEEGLATTAYWTAIAYTGAAVIYTIVKLVALLGSIN